MLALLIALALPATTRANGGEYVTDTAAAAWMARAEAAVGLAAGRGDLLRLVGLTTSLLRDQSDRTYQPYIMSPGSDTVWLDPASGVERTVDGGATFVRSARATFRVTRSGAAPDERMHDRFWSARALNPWIVLTEWARATDVHVAGHRRYRDYDHVLLTRPGRYGTDTLYLDARTAIPTRLARAEAHYFLGPIHVAYVYTTWAGVGRGALYPMSVTRLTDGEVTEHRFVDLQGASNGFVARDAAPDLTVPDSTVRLHLDPQLRFPPDAADTVPVGEGTYLLASHIFTSVVSLQADTVYILDSPADEVRARQDRAWVARLFPGRHALVFVAMNAVWPHIAGMRYWVSQGATVVAARPIVPYLRSVLTRRWTALPDTLERQHAHVRLTIRPVDDSASLGGGRITLFPMEGINGETVLLAYIAPSRFVWATDHIQDIASDNIYIEDVRRTVARHALMPATTSGPHFHIIPWGAIDSLPHIPAPPAPADTMSAGPAAAVDAFLDAISGPAGQIRDRARVHGLLNPNARYWILAADSSGRVRASTVDPHTALDQAMVGWEAHGFFERCVYHQVERWGSMAHVLCTYEIRRTVAGPVAVRGIDSAQLAFDGAQWQILSLYFHSESPGEQVPAAYGGPGGE